MKPSAPPENPSNVVASAYNPNRVFAVTLAVSLILGISVGLAVHYSRGGSAPGSCARITVTAGGHARDYVPVDCR